MAEASGRSPAREQADWPLNTLFCRIKVESKCQTFCSTTAIEDIKKELKFCGMLERFRQSCFGHFLDFDSSSKICSQLILSLLKRQIEMQGAKPHELWFRIGTKNLRFAKEHFCMITGLKFGASEFNPEVGDHEPPLDGVYMTYFKDQPVVIRDLHNKFRKGSFRDKPEDALLISYVIFITICLLGSNNRRRVPHWIWYLVEKRQEFQNFPWGAYAFQRTLHYFKTAFENANKPPYRIHGYPMVLQLWAFECIPEIRQWLVRRHPKSSPLHNGFPRCVRWCWLNKVPKILGIIDSPNLQATQIEPTEVEKDQPYMVGIETCISDGVQYVHQSNVIGCRGLSLANIKRRRRSDKPAKRKRIVGKPTQIFSDTTSSPTKSTPETSSDTASSPTESTPEASQDHVEQSSDTTLLFTANKIPDAEEVKLSLKVLINKEKTKVLFAEADNDFADVLLSFLRLPLGKIVKVLEKQYGDKAPSIGSLTTLYKGLTSPDIVNLWTKCGREVLENVESVFGESNLKISVDDTEPDTYEFGEPYYGVFTPNSASFIVCDDLRMLPSVSGSILQTLNKVGVDVMEMHGAEMRNVTFGLNEIIDLLRGSLISPTPLSDLVFNQRSRTKFAAVESEAGISSQVTSKSKKMVLKIMFQKSSKKLLFAEAEEDFVEFLFSLLIIPLGIVEWLLGCNTRLNNIDNLYKSIAALIDDKYVKGTDAKESLMKPKVKSVYSTSCFLPLSEESLLRASHQVEKCVFVAGSRMYMVTDDLTVTRLSVSSTLSLLNQMKISLSDVEEVELHIGLEEALNILKASLTSTRALTNGLINAKLKKQPKQEVHRV